LNLRSPDVAVAQPLRRDHIDYVAVLRRQAVVRRRRPEPDVVAFCDVARKRKKVAIAERVRAIFWGDKEIGAPSRSFQPPFAAKGFDDMVSGLQGASQQMRDFRAGGLPPTALAECENDPAFLSRE